MLFFGFGCCGEYSEYFCKKYIHIYINTYNCTCGFLVHDDGAIW